VDALALQQVGQRLARFFLDQCRGQGSRAAPVVEFDLGLSNEDLARQVGSVREVVSRTLSRLERDGLFTLSDSPLHGKRRRVIVHDPAALARYAGE
jgi:CRP-like cAMP-binding protein